VTGATAAVAHRSAARWRDWQLALVPWVVARLAVGAGYLLARWWFPRYGTGARPPALGQGLLAWDAAFYRSIAEDGYRAADGGLRFFPLVPMLARALSWPFGGRTDVALVVLANVCAFAFLVVLARVTREETGDEHAVRVVIWLGAVAPPAVVMVLGYAESTLLALAVATFWALRHDRFEWAAGLGFAAGLCRPFGALLALPALVEVARRWPDLPTVRRVAGVAAIGAPAAGGAAYLVWVGREYGDVLEPLRIQQDPLLRGGFRDPLSALVDALGGGLGGSRPTAAVHVLTALACLALLVVVARRLPASYTAFSAASLLLALSADNLDSFERYAFSAFPLLMGAALVVRTPLVTRVVLSASTLGLVATTMVVFLGRWVP
jgi:hypothetical protein